MFTDSVPSNSPADPARTPSAYARLLLRSLDLSVENPVEDNRDADALWAASGAMWLTGHADQPGRACPVALASCAQGAWLALVALSEGRLSADMAAFRLLGERAAIAGYRRQGKTSAGGACHFYHALDGALAVNLPREDDRELLPAWLQQVLPLNDEQALQAAVRQRAVQPLLEQARLLGLAVAPLVPPRACERWYRCNHQPRVKVAAPRQRSMREAPLVIDLSALWAGPLCGQLLSQCGARVIKVESSARPDGARQGPADFFHLMNAGKESVALDLRSAQGQSQLRELLLQADIVIEASRPRALEQMGIVAEEILQHNPALTWLAISGYGRQAPMREWIAYGDDAGVAAGLSWLLSNKGSDPVFVGDAIADPLTGLHAALLALASYRRGGGQLLDISLCEVVSFCIHATLPVTELLRTESIAAQQGATTWGVEPPLARPVSAVAAELGCDTERVLRELL